MRPKTRRSLGAVLAAACLAAPADPGSLRAETGPAHDGAVNIAWQYETQVRAYLPLLQEKAEPSVLSAALGDVRRAVTEIDQALAASSPGGPAPYEPGGVPSAAATAHLHLALFETRAHDFEDARREVERARRLLGGNAENFRAAWAARQEGGQGRAPETHYELRTFAEFEILLRAEWSATRAVAFDLNTLSDRDLGAITISEIPGATARESDHPLVERAAALLHEAVASGQRSFAVPLPPGVYSLSGRPGSGIDRSFMVPEAADPDPVVVAADRFALRLEPPDREHGLRFFLNGVEIVDLNAMPYGYYRVKTDPQSVKSAPRLIRFIPGLGIDNRSRSVWTVFVPRGEMTVLRFITSSPGGRLRN